jgi:hypothetical protein
VQNVEVAYLYKVRSKKKKYPPRRAAPPACRRQVKYNQLEPGFTISPSLSAAGLPTVGRQACSVYFHRISIVFLNISLTTISPNFPSQKNSCDIYDKGVTNTSKNSSVNFMHSISSQKKHCFE